MANACQKFTTETHLAETTRIIVIEENYKRIDDTKKADICRAITTILTESSKHQVLKAFKWHTMQSLTRPAEFWEALAKVAPNLQHLSFNFSMHELHRMEELGISVRMLLSYDTGSNSFFFVFHSG
jgi:hypothetical protein